MDRNKCLLVLVFCCNLIFGQFKNLKFEKLSTAEGLSSSTCLESFQDSKGYLWFGTIDGLNRYDGYEFKIYRPVFNDSTSISNNRINVIQEDKDSNLWIGTNNGLNFYDRNTEIFTQVDIYNGLDEGNETKKIINSLVYDKKKNQIWVGTSDGLIKVILKKDTRDLKGLNITHYKYSKINDNSIDSDNIVAIVNDKEGFVWVATSGKYLNKYNAEKDNFERFLIENKKGYLLNHMPKRVFVDSNNNFWIGNDASNIVYWNRSDNTFQHIAIAKESVPFYKFFEESIEDRIWLVTDGKGVYIYEQETKKIHHLIKSSNDQFSLPGNQICDFFEDKDGVFWLGTYNHGVIKLDMEKSTFGHHYYQEGRKDGLNEKIVQSVMQDSKGRIWLGAYNGGLNLFEEETNTFKAYSHDPKDRSTLKSNKILYTFEGSDGIIWVCTLDGGLNKFDSKTGKNKRFYHVEEYKSTIGQNSVWTGVEDDRRRIWLGLRNEGVDLFDFDRDKFHHFKIGEDKQEGLLSNSIFHTVIDSKNRLLIGTSLGLNYVVLDSIKKKIPERIKFETVDIEGVSGNQINYIEEDYLHNIWLGTDIGVFKLDSDLQLLKSYFTQDGLPNNLVTGIKEDLDHNFWITTRSGLSFLNPKTDQFKNFNTQDGIQGMEYQSKSIERIKDGRILVGGINGFNIFNPQDISITSWAVLKSEITGLKINNEYVQVGQELNSNFTLSKPLSKTEEIELDYDQVNLAFDFISMYFQNQEQVQYAYKMDGVDKDFVKAGKNRTVNYSNLRPGNYTFYVKSSINDDWDLAPFTSIKIKLNSPPWKTWWAYTIYLVVCFVCLWNAQEYYARRLNRKQEREFDQMKLKFFINVSHEFRTPLTLILNPLDKLLTGYSNPETVKKSAQSIQRSARRLLYLVNQLLDYRKMEQGMFPLQLQKGDIIKFTNDIYTLFKDITNRKDIEYTFESKSKQINSFFDMDKIEKILTNLISNAIKFTESGNSIKVTVDKKTNTDTTSLLFNKRKTKLKEYIEIVVEDTGIGMEKDQVAKIFSRFYNVDANKTGTGIGLNFTEGLVEIHGGEIFVESEYQKGSKFVVRIPYYRTAKSSQINNVKDEFLLNSMQSVEYDMLISDTEHKEESSEATDGKGLPKLLIVEDNKELRDHLKNELKPFYTIIEAVHGEEGWAKVSKHYPDVVVSDVMMPKMDGFELCKKIKSEFETCHIPVVLLTARALGEDRIEGYKTGADGYLGKPFNINVLKARIDNLLEAKRIIKEKFSKLGAVITPNEVTSNSIDEAFIEKTTKVILEHISDTDFKMEHLLKEIGIGRSQFYRKIQSITGQNPSNFIRTIRLKYASDLLVKDIYTIKEVTHMAGFNSAAYFGKTFRELYGMTPSEYMEKNKAQ